MAGPQRREAQSIRYWPTTLLGSSRRGGEADGCSAANQILADDLQLGPSGARAGELRLNRCGGERGETAMFVGDGRSRMYAARAATVTRRSKQGQG
jgi:hypothetical protein